MRSLALAAALCGWPLAAWPVAAWAGPPYVTDDAQPTDTGHWEIYAFASGVETSGNLAGETGLDINYGGAKDLQLTVVVPATFENTERLGAGDLELAAKYKFLHQQDGGWLPDVAFFPRVFVPTASKFTGEHAGLLLPLWAEKDFGPWSVFGGGGLQINPGAGQRNFWQGGLVVSRSVGDRASLGVEVYHQTADQVGGKDFTGMNVGATYKLSRHWTLMASGGPGLQNAREGGRFDFYTALLANY